MGFFINYYAECYLLVTLIRIVIYLMSMGDIGGFFSNIGIKSSFLHFKGDYL